MPESEELKKARKAAFKCISYRDRSEYEVSEFLTKKNFDRDVIKETLGYLRELDYINDERFARSWGRSRVEGKKIGETRLRQELSSKGISKNIIDRVATLFYSEISEKRLALDSAKKKLASLTGIDNEKKRRRLVQFLYRKGFPSGIVFKTVAELISENIPAEN